MKSVLSCRLVNAGMLALLVGAAAALSGCDSWFKSDKFDGKTPMSADQVDAAAKREEDKATARADAAVEAFKRKITDEAAENARKAAARKRALDRALAGADAEHRAKMQELADAFEADMGDLTAAYERVRRDTEQAAATVTQTVKDTLADIAARRDAAQADIATRAEYASFLSGAAQQYGGMVPGGGIVAGLLSGLVGIGIGRAGRKKELDKTWDEASNHKEAEVAKRDAAWNEAQLSLLKMLTPPPASVLAVRPPDGVAGTIGTNGSGSSASAGVAPAAAAAA